MQHHQRGYVKGGGSGETYVTQADILNQGRVEVASLTNLLEQSIDKVLERRVLEATLLRLGQGCSDGKSDNDIVGVLGLAVRSNGG